MSASASYNWDNRLSASSGAATPSPSGLIRRASNQGLSTSAPDEGMNTRHWAFNASRLFLSPYVELTSVTQAFEWVVRDVQKLKEHIESLHDSGTSSHDAEGNGEFEILKESPMLGDGKFKLEIGEPLLSISLYACSHYYSQADYT